ncbi:MAG: hypothetical protein ACFNYI_07490, partial [Eubacterium sp.]
PHRHPGVSVVPGRGHLLGPGRGRHPGPGRPRHGPRPDRRGHRHVLPVRPGGGLGLATPAVAAQISTWVADKVTKAGTLAKEAQIVQTATSNSEIQNEAVSQVGITASTEQIAAAATSIYLQKQGMSATEAASKAKEYLQAAALYQDAEKSASSNTTALINYAAASSDAVKNASSQLNSVKTSLDSLVAYVKAVETYTAGVDSAYAGSKKLVSGAASLASGAQQLNSGAASLASGAQKLSKGTQTLTNGISSLASGANTLSNGMNKFNSQGIQKLTGSLNEDELKDMVNRLQAIVQASKRSDMIGGIADNMTGESRMIFKTMEVKK